jgi:hypothetical protein
MKLVRALVFTLLIAGTLSINGCGGGGTDIKANTYSTTLGQELQDLQTAYNKGIISEKEYNQAKEALIKKRTQK